MAVLCQKLRIGLKQPIMDRDSGRRFEAQFFVLKKEGKRQRQFFIFSDILIVANKGCAVKKRMNVRTLDIRIETEHHIQGMPEFTLISTERSKPTAYIAKSVGELAEIERLIKKNRVRVWDRDLAQLMVPTDTLQDQLEEQFQCD